MTNEIIKYKTRVLETTQQICKGDENLKDLLLLLFGQRSIATSKMTPTVTPKPGPIAARWKSFHSGLSFTSERKQNPQRFSYTLLSEGQKQLRKGLFQAKKIIHVLYNQSRALINTCQSQEKLFACIIIMRFLGRKSNSDEFNRNI